MAVIGNMLTIFNTYDHSFNIPVLTCQTVSRKKVSDFQGDVVFLHVTNILCSTFKVAIVTNEQLTIPILWSQSVIHVHLDCGAVNVIVIFNDVLIDIFSMLHNKWYIGLGNTLPVHLAFYKFTICNSFLTRTVPRPLT